jgi:hypothetical protein
MTSIKYKRNKMLASLCGRQLNSKCSTFVLRVIIDVMGYSNLFKYCPRKKQHNKIIIIIGLSENADTGQHEDLIFLVSL